MSIKHHRYVIAVPDLQRSAQFYRDILGFEIITIEDPGWLFAKKEDCMIMMGECTEAIDPHDLGDHAYFAYLEVDNVDAYYQQIVDAGGQPRALPEDKPWGMREFPMQTIDGHSIMVSQAVQ